VRSDAEDVPERDPVEDRRITDDEMSYQTTNGYRRCYDASHPRANSKGEVYEHVQIAERALGRYLPTGAEIHHVDENPSNNAQTNLVICQDKAYHKLLHVRARIVRAGGNPNTHLICSKCGEPKPLEMFSMNRGNKGTGRQNACRPCAAIYWRDRQDFLNTYIPAPNEPA
jgi:hypothetical protein